MPWITEQVLGIRWIKGKGGGERKLLASLLVTGLIQVPL